MNTAELNRTLRKKQMEQVQLQSRILRRKDVLNRLGIASTTLHNMIHKGMLPKPFKINERSVGWLESDIEAFITSRVTKSS